MTRRARRDRQIWFVIIIVLVSLFVTLWSMLSADGWTAAVAFFVHIGGLLRLYQLDRRAQAIENRYARTGARRPHWWAGHGT